MKRMTREEAKRLADEETRKNSVGIAASPWVVDLVLRAYAAGQDSVEEDRNRLRNFGPVQAAEIARDSALKHVNDHNYLCHVRNSEWRPHAWVVEAIEKAYYAGFRVSSLAEAVDLLRSRLKRDQDYAWSWHCNVAMAIYDTTTHPNLRTYSNRAAGTIMSRLFGVDTLEMFEKSLKEDLPEIVQDKLCDCAPGTCIGRVQDGINNDKSVNRSGKCKAIVPAEKVVKELTPGGGPKVLNNNLSRLNTETEGRLVSCEAPLTLQQMNDWVTKAGGAFGMRGIDSDDYTLSIPAMAHLIADVAAHAARTAVREAPRVVTSDPRPGDIERTWECKIGGLVGELPPGADGPLRAAVEEAFRKLTGREPAYNMTGWGGKLTKLERDVVEKRVSPASKTWEVITPAGQSVSSESLAQAMTEARRIFGSAPEERREDEKAQAVLRGKIIQHIEKTTPCNFANMRADLVADGIMKLLRADDSSASLVYPRDLPNWQRYLALALREMAEHVSPAQLSFPVHASAEEFDSHLKKLYERWEQNICPF